MNLDSSDAESNWHWSRRAFLLRAGLGAVGLSILAAPSRHA